MSVRRWEYIKRGRCYIYEEAGWKGRNSIVIMSTDRDEAVQLSKKYENGYEFKYPKRFGGHSGGYARKISEFPENRGKLFYCADGGEIISVVKNGRGHTLWDGDRMTLKLMSDGAVLFDIRSNKFVTVKKHEAVEVIE